MYKFKDSVNCAYGSFCEGNTYSLAKIPKSIVDSWLSTGLISKQKLPEMPDKKPSKSEG